MFNSVQRRSWILAGVVIAALAAGAAACGGKDSNLPSGMLEADKFLFDRGQDLLAQKKWIQAREYFQQIVENYPQSTYRPDAKLGMGDSYIGEGSVEALVLAQNEFNEFLTFYPNNPRADYAQYRVGYSHYQQMRSADRDQSETAECVVAWEAFVERYPNSSLMEEVQTKLREAKDRLAESDYRVGFFYYRVRWYPGAIDRFRSLLTKDPAYSGRDAVYYYLAECLVFVNRPAEALPYLERLVQEFEQSEFLVKAEKRIAELKASPAIPK